MISGAYLILRQESRTRIMVFLVMESEIKCHLWLIEGTVTG